MILKKNDLHLSIRGHKSMNKFLIKVATLKEMVKMKRKCSHSKSPVIPLFQERPG
jgi:hypothetical protein